MIYDLNIAHPFYFLFLFFFSFCFLLLFFFGVVAVAVLLWSVFLVHVFFGFTVCLGFCFVLFFFVFFTTAPSRSFDRLVGLMVKESASRVEDPRFNGIFPSRVISVT